MSLKLVRREGLEMLRDTRTVNGERIERSTGFTTRREADGYLKKALKEVAEDRLRLPSDPTFASAAARYQRNGGDGGFIDKLIEAIGDKR